MRHHVTMRKRPSAHFPNFWSYHRYIISPKLVCLTIPTICILFAKPGELRTTATLQTSIIHPKLFGKPMRYSCIHRWLGAPGLIAQKVRFPYIPLCYFSPSILVRHREPILSFYSCVSVCGNVRVGCFCVHGSESKRSINPTNQPLYCKAIDPIPFAVLLLLRWAVAKSNRITCASGRTGCASVLDELL